MMDTSGIPQFVPGAVTVAVTSGKGGVGKTTLAVALATQLASRGHDVVVVDADIDGPNVHLLADVTKFDLVPVADPLSLVLPKTDLGFRLVSPLSVHAAAKRARVTFNDLGAIAQFADPPDVVIVDLPPGWTIYHADVVAVLPDLVVAAVSPTATSVSDHHTHVQMWSRTWSETVKKIAESDKRRRWDHLVPAPTVVSVETLARFSGLVDGDSSGRPVTIRRSDALTVENMASQVDVFCSVPTLANVTDVAASNEVGLLADKVDELVSASTS